LLQQLFLKQKSEYLYHIS